jgi:ATP-dependent DNA ligase
MPPLKPMLAKAVHEVPSGPDLGYEPKWDGFRCIVFRDGDEIEMGSRNERPFNRYFPELLVPLKEALPEKCVVDGELIVRIDGELDFDALGQRIHPADSRVQMLAEQTPAEFIVFDVIAAGDLDLTGEPFAVRRGLLERLAEDFTGPVLLTPQTTDFGTAVEWFERFEGAGLDGLMAKPLSGVYVPDKRVQIKVKHRRTADCVVAGFRMHKSGDGVGSLILGLYADDGALWHVGVAASFRASARAELLEELTPHRLDDLAAHPWASWADEEAHASGSMPGAPSRWNNDRDQSWIPIRIERVAEVSYAHASNGRFRGTTSFIRWRPDREPASCLHTQLVQADPLPFDQVLAAAD